jgi:hypothetical protein
LNSLAYTISKLAVCRLYWHFGSMLNLDDDDVPRGGLRRLRFCFRSLAGRTRFEDQPALQRVPNSIRSSLDDDEGELRRRPD